MSDFLGGQLLYSCDAPSLSDGMVINYLLPWRSAPGDYTKPRKQHCCGA